MYLQTSQCALLKEWSEDTTGWIFSKLRRKRNLISIIPNSISLTLYKYDKQIQQDSLILPDIRRCFWCLGIYFSRRRFIHESLASSKAHFPLSLLSNGSAPFKRSNSATYGKSVHVSMPRQ